ncbi:hypothetical protein CRM22_008438 [Opisthorchis felineus]|uniref:Immunoglobulin domain-containing protein n=1 Tax=Opisthorchis felineus TaxID=147828 RepID=A0A4V6RGU5_OPIFE|nr:hypothetical protein CRM22_008438 [Opisthorchis felineus]TGZ60634.1 hypothetical protein CRM22_008438 [Opisthorchis felineus]
MILQLFLVLLLLSDLSVFGNSCNTMQRFLGFDVYPNYLNTNFSYTKVRLLNSELNRLLYYEIRKPRSILSVNIRYNKASVADYDCHENNFDKCCCLNYRKCPLISMPCREHSVLIVASDSRRYVILVHLKVPTPDVLVRLVWEKGEFYFSNQPGRRDDIVCPEFSKDHSSSTPPNVGNSLRGRKETHELQYSDILRTVEHLEYQELYISLCGFATRRHSPRVCIIRHFPKDPQLIMDCSKLNEVKAIFTEDIALSFTVRFQWHSAYGKNFHCWKHSQVVTRHTIAVLFLIHETNISSDGLIRSVLTKWIISQNRETKFVWPKTAQSPAIRFVRFHPTRHAIYQEGQDVILKIDPDEIHPTLDRLCFKRLRKSAKYQETTRMRIGAGKSYIEMRNVTITDSGMYMCRNPEGEKPTHPFILDYYIIVLPRPKDIQVIISSYPLSTKDRLEETYTNKDVMNRTYFHMYEPVYVSCIYLLSKGLDNYDGFGTEYSGSSDSQPEQVGSFTRDFEDLFLTVNSFKIIPQYSDEVVLRNFTCIHHYRQNFELVRHDSSLPDSATKIYKMRQFVNLWHNPPLFITSSIQTTSESLTAVLRHPSRSLTDLYQRPDIDIASVGIVAEGVIQGSFVALLRYPDGWGSIFIHLQTSAGNSGHSIPCSHGASKIILHPNDDLLKSEEMDRSHTLSAMLFQFECLAIIGTTGLVLSLYNPKQESVKRENIEHDVKVWISQMLDNKKVSENTKESYNTNSLVSGELKLVQWSVRWRATVNIGDTVKMFWHLNATDVEQFHCKYAPNNSAPMVDIKNTFIAHALMNLTVYEVTMRRVHELNSGLYRCHSCSDCSELYSVDARRLVVLPRDSEIFMQIFPLGGEYTGSGTMQDPIKTQATFVEVLCSYEIPYGLVGDFEWQVTYETRIPNVNKRLRLHTVEKQRTIKKHQKSYSTYVIHLVPKPKAYEYWEYTCLNCTLHVANVIRDRLDILDSLEQFSISRSLYFEYDMVRGPVIIPEITTTSDGNLTKAFRMRSAGDLDSPPVTPTMPDITEMENIYTINYTLFMGIPKGQATVWTVAKVEDGLDVSECELDSVISISDSSRPEQLNKSRIYHVNGGANFEQRRYTCLLDVHVAAVIMLGFYTGRKAVTVKRIENQVKSYFLSLVELKLSGQLKEQFGSLEKIRKELENITAISYVMAWVKLLWAASLAIGESAEMLGLSPPENMRIQCFHKASDQEAKVPSYKWSINALPDSPKYMKVQLKKLSLGDSGLYMCNVSTVCSFCSPRVGITARLLVVLPDSNETLIHLKHSSDMYGNLHETDFSQYFHNGTAFLWAKQPVIMECRYNAPLLKRMKPQLYLAVRMFDPELGRYVPLPISSQKPSLVQSYGMTTITARYLVYTPDAITCTGDLKFTCRITYRIGAISHNSRDQPGVIQLLEEKDISVLISASPYIYASEVRTDFQGLTEKWKRNSDYFGGAMTARQFHASCSPKRLLERRFTVSALIAYGVPRGEANLWGIYEYDGKLELTSCLIRSSNQKSGNRIPLEIRIHNSYKESGGRNIFDVLFECALQPNYVAMAFLAYNAQNESVKMPAEKLLLDQLLQNVQFWLDKPENSDPVYCPKFTGLRSACETFKVNIGRKLFITSGSDVKILLLRTDNEGAECIIYYQKSRNSTKRAIKSVIVDRSNEYFILENAAYDDSGFYSSEVIRGCESCKVRHCFPPARVTVVSETPIFDIHLMNTLVQDNQTTADNKSFTLLSGKDTAFVYCVYLRPVGFSNNEIITVRYTVHDSYGNVTREIKPLAQPARSIRLETGTLLVMPFKIAAPLPESEQNYLLFSCSLTLSRFDLDETDISYRIQTQPITVSRKIGTDVVLAPLIFVSLTMINASEDLGNWLRNSLNEPKIPLLFHKTAPASPIQEGLYTITIFASLGLPKGWVKLGVFAEQDRVIQEELCLLMHQTSLTQQTMQRELLQHKKYLILHDNSMVSATFICALRKENFALAIIAYTNTEDTEQSTLEEVLSHRLRSWFRTALEKPSAKTAIPLMLPPNWLAHFVVVKLDMGWNAHIGTGDNTSWYGFLGRANDLIDCYAQKEVNGPKSTLSSQFTIHRLEESPAFILRIVNAKYEDSAIYTCVLIRPGFTPIKTIVARRLVVLPDATLVDIFLTHQLLKQSDTWREHSTVRDSQNRNVIFVGTTNFINCLHKTHHREWLIVSVTFEVHVIEFPNKTVILPLQLMQTLTRPNVSVLNSARLTLIQNREYGNELEVKCVWTFTSPYPMSGDLSHAKVPTTLTKSKKITLQLAIDPVIYTHVADADDLVTRTVIRRVNWQTRNAPTFHSKAYTISGEERIVCMHLMVMLGAPRGWVNAWTMYTHQGQLIKESCFKKALANITDQSIPNELKSDSYKYGEEFNLVNTTWVCNFRLEHVALFVTAHNYRYLGGGSKKYVKSLEFQIVTALESWLRQPKSDDKWKVKLPEGVSFDYRVYKLSIRWSDTVPVGGVVRMLGYLPTRPESLHECFHHYDRKAHPLSKERKFRSVIQKDGFGFFLLKSEIEFQDSGVYSCNVTPTSKDFTLFQTTFAFTPRRLLVLPSDSVLFLYTKRKPIGQTNAISDWKALSDADYLERGESAFAYCEYMKPRGLPNFPVHSVALTLSNEYISGLKYIDSTVQERDTYQVLTKIYEFKMPFTSRINDIMTVNCTVNYSDVAVILTVQKHISLHIFIKPVIFRDQINTSNSVLTQAFRKHLDYAYYDAEAFHSSQPERIVLEGTVYVNYMAGIGVPPGWSQVQLISFYSGLFRSRPCMVQEVQDLSNLTTLQESLRNSSYFQQTAGLGLMKYNFSCPLTLDVVAIVLVAMNTAHTNITTTFLILNFTRIVEKWIESWFTGSTHEDFRFPKGWFLHYSLFRIKVGWRASIPGGSSIVIYGNVIDVSIGNVTCFHHKIGEEKHIIHFSPQTFMINYNSDTRAIELVKPSANADDSGVYECKRRRCPTCDLSTAIIPHHLIVLSNQITLYTHLSKQVVTSHNKTQDGWVYPYVDPDGPFIYSSQSITVTCELHVDVGINASPNLQFSTQYIVSATKTHIELSYIPITVAANKEPNYWSVSHFFKVQCPPGAFSGDTLKVTCELMIQDTDPNLEDINQKFWMERYSKTRLLSIRTWVKPRIVTSSISTNDNLTTELLQAENSRKPNAHWFRWAYGRLKIDEGILVLNYSLIYGNPIGWSDAIAVYRRPVGFRYRKCKRHYDYTGSKESENGTNQPATYLRQNLTFYCLLLPEHIGILIYTAHYVGHQARKSDFENEFLPNAVRTIEEWLLDGSDLINLPVDSYGEYRLCPVPVKWKNRVKIGEQVRMYGFLDIQVHRSITCFYGPTEPQTQLLSDRMFFMDFLFDQQHFILTKQNIAFSDSGVYNCTIIQCDECAEVVGFASRKLTVLPDDSIVNLELHIIDSFEQNCSTEQISVVVPGQTLNITCTHLVSKAFPSTAEPKITTEVKDLSSVITRMEDQSAFVEEIFDNAFLVVSNTKLHIYPFVQDKEILTVRCTVPFNPLYKDANESKSFVPEFLRREQHLKILRKRTPQILNYEVRNNFGDLVENNRFSGMPSNSDFMQNRSTDIKEEGLFTVNFTAFLGEPPGWTFVRLYYIENRNVVAEQPCNIWQKTSVSNMDQQVIHQSACAVQPEHIAILLAVAHSEITDSPKRVIEQKIEFFVQKRIEEWLNLSGSEKIPGEDDQCFVHDLRLVRLRIRWRATVAPNTPIHMQGRLGNQNIKDIQCFYQASVSHQTVPITSAFVLTSNASEDRFYLTKPYAKRNDTGIYHCKATSGLNGTQYTGMQPRQLIVLPTAAVVQCDLSLNKSGKQSAANGLQLSDGLIYFPSGQSAFVRCQFELELEKFYNFKHDAEYRTLNETDGTGRTMNSSLGPVFIEQRIQNDSMVKIYKIFSPTAKHYTGLLTVGCVGRFSQLTTAIDVAEPREDIVISCYQNFTIREPANGELIIITTSKDYDKQPVPLGSEFLCTGGYGVPRLAYRWIQESSDMYIRGAEDPDIPSMLPEGGGSWGRPQKPFVDMPNSTGLHSEGPLLRIPNDPLYRGMSYRYTCLAFNTVYGRQYFLNTTITFTVLICPTDYVTIDLSILLSPRLLSACTLENNKRPEIQFYGYFYLALVRQLVLGLPVSPERTRISFVRAVREWKDSKTTYSASNFTDMRSRKDMAIDLYSRRYKLASSKCTSSPVNLTGVLEAVNAVNMRSKKRTPVFLIAIDAFTDVTNSSRLLSQIEMIRKANIKVILATTYSSDGPIFENFHKRIVALLNPFRVLRITPNFDGVDECGTCRIPIDGNQLRIRRSELFDTLCESTLIRKPKFIGKPVLEYPLPKFFWLHGESITVSCTGAEVVFEEPYLHTQLFVCLTNMTLVLQLKDYSSPGILQLIRACKLHLANSSISANHSKPASVTARIIVKNKSNNSLVLCFQRIGEEILKVFDTVTYVYDSVEVGPAYIGVPEFSVEQWEPSERRAALLKCTFVGFLPHLRVYLLRKSTNKRDTDGDVYSIIAETAPKRNLKSILTSVKINWIERQNDTNTKVLICLVRLRSDSWNNLRTIKQLPKQSETLKYRELLHIPPFFTDCPTAPTLKVNKTVSKFGSRLQASCEVNATSYGSLLRLAYLTPSGSFIICHMHREATPCRRTTPDDRDCSANFDNSRYQEQLMYSSQCLAKLDENGTVIVNYITFIIRKLSAKDFNGHLFCHAIDTAAVETPEESKKYVRLISDIYVVHFAFPPEVTFLYFDPKTQWWECQVSAYPLTGQADLQTIQVQPVWLRNQLLEYYVRTSNSAPPTVNNQSLIPKALLQKTRYLRYSIRLTLRSTMPVPGGLTKGEVVTRCNLGNISRLLTTKLGEISVRDDTVQSPVEIPQAGLQINILCTIDLTGVSHIRHISLHRLLETNWATYDFTVVVIRVLESKRRHQEYNVLKTRHTILGIWTCNAPRNVRILSHWTEDIISVDITLVTSLEYDTGSYYCSGRSVDGDYKTTTIQSKLISGTSIDAAFGYQLKNGRGRWFRSTISMLHNEPVLVRCIVWTTNPLSEATKEHRITTPWESDEDNGLNFQSAKPHNIIRSKVDLYISAHKSQSPNTFTCEFQHGTRTYKLLVQGPDSKCEAPRNLRTKPNDMASYPRSAIIECLGSKTCESTSFHWRWVAGPIPQVSVEIDRVDDNLVSSAGILFLSRLPRSGTYIFLCIVDCLCGNITTRKSISTTINVQADFHDEKRDLSSKIVDVELHPEAKKDISQDDILLKDISDKKAKDTDTDEAVGVRKRYVKDEKTEHIETEEARIMLPLQMVDHVVKGTRRDYGVTVQADKTNFEYYHMYPIRRSPENSELFILPSQFFVSIAPDDKEQLRWLYQATSCSEYQAEPCIIENLKGEQRMKLHYRDHYMRETALDSLKLAPRAPHLLDVRSHVSSQYDAAELHRDRQRRDLLRRHAGIYGEQRAASTVGIREAGAWRGQDTSESKWNRFGESERDWNVSGKHSRSSWMLGETESLDTIRLTTSVPEYNLDIPSHSEIQHEDSVHPRGISNKNRIRFLKCTDKSAADTHFKRLRMPLFNSGLHQRGKVPMLIQKDNLLKPSTKMYENYAVKFPARFGSPYLRSDRELYSKQKNVLRDTLHWRSPPKNVEAIWLTDFYSDLSNETLLEQSLKSSSIKDDYFYQHKRIREFGVVNRPSFRHFHPTERRGDIQITNDQIRRLTPWWQTLVRWSYGSESPLEEPLYNLSTYPTYKTTRDTFLKPMPTNHPPTWTGDNRELTARNAHATYDMGGQFSDTMELKPGFVYVSGSTSGVCPIVLGSQRALHSFLKLSWERYPSLVTLPEPIADVDLEVGRMRLRSARFGYPNRIFTYPPLKWPRAHTLDITGLTTEDFGYYACVHILRLSNRSNRTVNVLKRSMHPLCIMDKQTKPKLILVEYNYTSLSKGRYQDGKRISEATAYKNACYSQEDVLVAYCVAQPYRLFCEKPDQVVNGTRLVQTMFRSFIHLGAEINHSRKLHLPEPTEFIPPSEALTADNSPENYHAWRVPLQWNTERISINCEIYPQLVPPTLGSLGYWNWLNSELDAHRHQELRLSSEHITLCLRVDPEYIQISPRPTRQRDDIWLDVVNLQPQNTISCQTGTEAASMPNMTFYPIQSYKLSQATTMGLVSLSQWLDNKRFPVQWPKSSHPNLVRFYIPANQSVLGFYIVRCSIPETGRSKTFLLEIYPQEYRTFWKLDIKKMWIAITLPLIVFIYVSLRSYFRATSSGLIR